PLYPPACGGLMWRGPMLVWCCSSWLVSYGTLSQRAQREREQRLHADGTCLGEERLHVRRDGAVLRRRATEARGLVTLGATLDARSLRRIAEDVYRLLTELHLAQVVLQHLAVEDDAFIGMPQALFGAIGDGALGDPGEDILAGGVVHQLPGRLALGIGQRQGN